MKQETKDLARFLTAVTVYQLVTYFVAGILASSLFNYRELFGQPIIRDYFRDYGSVEIAAGPLLQILRGFLFALVLVPWRGFLRAQPLGWLWLWLLFIGMGILGTPAASPASLEGVIYTKLPLWFHLLGLPEILLQTLAFSVLVHRHLRKAEHPLPEVFQRALQALVLTCLSFIGYTVVSLAFAVAAGVSTSQGSADLRVLGQFIAPLVLLFALNLLQESRGWWMKQVALYVLSVASLGLYQQFVLGSAGWLYVLTAPVLPGLIAAWLSRPKRRPEGTP